MPNFCVEIIESWTARKTIQVEAKTVDEARKIVKRLYGNDEDEEGGDGRKFTGVTLIYAYKIDEEEPGLQPEDSNMSIYFAK